MDKIMYYKLKDKITENTILMKITTKNFPIQEYVEFESKNISTSDIDELQVSEDLKIRLNNLLNDNNIRLILDVLEQKDEYYINKLNINVLVEAVELIDN